MAEPEIRELRYFRAVAEELNITRAAERLGIAQPPLSRAIRQLESRLGVDLFDRSGTRLILTEAGETLLKESGPVLEALDSAVRRTQRAARGARGPVVTAKPGVATELLHRVVGELEPESVEILVSGFGEQADMVRDGRADVAIVSRPFDARGLECEPLYSEPRVAALPVGHELADREVLHVSELADYPAPRWGGAGGSDFNYWAARPEAPVEGPTVHDTSQLLEVIAFGQAIALVPQSMALRNIRPEVVYRPVTGAEPYEMLVVWPAGSRSPEIAQFVRAAVKHSTEPPAVP